jgi:GNAT superfamily N-acetyltransferase
MTSLTTIRPANEHDLVALRRLYHEFHEFHVRSLPDRLRSLGDPDSYDWTEFDARVKGIVRAEDSIILLAESTDQPVGLAEVYIRQDDAANTAIVPHYYGYLQSLIVTESHRGYSIGGQLIAAAEAWARQHEASEMQLDTWEFAAGPLQLYEKSGYRTLKRVLVKAI